MPLESAIERKVCLEIVAAWEHAVCPKWGREGWPDRQILLGEGQTFWIEFKQKNEALRADQKVRLRDLVTAGNVALVIDEVDDGKALAQCLKGCRNACRALACVAIFAARHAPTQRAIRLSRAGRPHDR